MNATTAEKNKDLPPPHEGVLELADNLWWTWHEEAHALFASLDPDLWAACGMNASRLLASIPEDQLQEKLKAPDFQDRYHAVMTAYRAEMGKQATTWYEGRRTDGEIAYFCMEYGLATWLPFYAGGLGVLAGDHLKACSDLGVPLIGVGLLYKEGAGVQRISADGDQATEFLEIDVDKLPLERLENEDGSPLLVSLPLGDRSIEVQIWKLQVGRVPLYLLDSDVDSNMPDDRAITARLYPSEAGTRIKQEIVLGIGGVRALRLLGHEPAVWHMNEGHSVMLVLANALDHLERGSTLDAALERVRSNTVFTTHTPVPAGHEKFSLDLIRSLLVPYRAEAPELVEQLIDEACESGESFGMARLAMRMSNRRNAVSELHGKVARGMWAHLWPDRPIEQVPIGHITNGVHLQTWLAPEFVRIFDEKFGLGWINAADDPETWQAIRQIADATIWGTHLKLKERMLRFLASRAIDGEGVNRLSLDPRALTIGFARRFVTYKRADLVFKDAERIAALMADPNRPVQIVMTGKAHPADQAGQALLKEVYLRTGMPEFAGRFVFVPDYNMDVARYLVQGVDVWLNTPRVPNEASGTSGQKAAMNGVLNFSILDGWWAEAYTPEIGWSFGDPDPIDDEETQDDLDARDLLDTLENEILPYYYDGSPQPAKWIGMMKNSIQQVSPDFTARRMIKQYVEQLYRG
ncbi:MAG: alpha-glucan family phosphorylase [Anaerolineales bacterium]|nr:alpha-glucan family phosphorylase [Anaerolineales bacterium]